MCPKIISSFTNTFGPQRTSSSLQICSQPPLTPNLSLLLDSEHADSVPSSPSPSSLVCWFSPKKAKAAVSQFH